MPHQEHAIGFAEIVPALYHYLREIEEQYEICKKHLTDAAIHSKGKSLQIYRQFHRCPKTAKHLRKAADSLSVWEKSPLWKYEQENWIKLKKQVDERVKRHSKQHEVLSKGILWQERPILIHAYKFEPDSAMKIELVVPDISHYVDELPSAVVADVLQCHECLVPECVAEARAVYERHEAEFLTIKEYLAKAMSKGLYASRAFFDSG